MFTKLFKKSTEKKQIQIIAPLNGEIVPLEEVPDPVFNQKMMGEGIAIIPKKGKILAPVNGTIIQIPETKHAIGIQAEDGIEILIHIGLETVGLKGEGFNVHVESGKRVSVGELLLEFDLDFVKNNASHTVTPIIITNSGDQDKHYQMTDEKQAIAGETIIMTVSDQ